jgi:hypothetical protein
LCYTVCTGVMGMEVREKATHKPLVREFKPCYSPGARRTVTKQPSVAGFLRGLAMESCGYLPLLFLIGLVIILLSVGAVKAVAHLRDRILERKRKARPPWFDEPGD